MTSGHIASWKRLQRVSISAKVLSNISQMKQVTSGQEIYRDAEQRFGLVKEIK